MDFKKVGFSRQGRECLADVASSIQPASLKQRVCLIYPICRFIRPKLNLLGIILLSLAMFGLNTGFIAALSASSHSLLVSRTTSADAGDSSRYSGGPGGDYDSAGPAGEATVQEIGTLSHLRSLIISPQLTLFSLGRFHLEYHVYCRKPYC